MSKFMWVVYAVAFGSAAFNAVTCIIDHQWPELFWTTIAMAWIAISFIGDRTNDLLRQIINLSEYRA